MPLFKRIEIDFCEECLALNVRTFQACYCIKTSLLNSFIFNYEHYGPVRDSHPTCSTTLYLKRDSATGVFLWIFRNF